MDGLDKDTLEVYRKGLYEQTSNEKYKDLKFKQAKDKIKKFMDNSGIEESVKEQINTILNKNKKIILH